MIKRVESAEQVAQLHAMTLAMAHVMGGEISLTMDELQVMHQRNAFNGLIAYAGDKPVGYTVWSEGFHTYDGLFMYIDDIFVDEAYRHQGIGKLLLSTLINVATQNDYRNIEWLVETDNAELKRWYDSVGSAALAKYEYRRLPSAKYTGK